jgi:hypothetical protein
MMIAVLTDWGRDNSEQVSSMLARLLPSQKEPSAVGAAWKLLRKSRIRTTEAAQNAQKIAAEVAGNLGLREILESALGYSDPTVRAAAVRAAYYLWQRDPESGLALLGVLSTKVMRGIIPDLSIFESMLGLSLSIFFDHYEDAAVLRGLQQVWKGVISQILGIQEEGSKLARSAREFLREKLFAFAIDKAFTILGEMPAGLRTPTLPELEAFFRLSPADKELNKRLAWYLASPGRAGLEEMEEDWMLAVRVPDSFTARMMGMSIFANIEHKAYVPASFLRRLLRTALELPAPTVAVNYVTSPISERSLLHPSDDEWYSLFEEALELNARYFSEHPHIPGVPYPFSAPDTMYFYTYAFVNYARSGTARTPLMDARIRRAIDRHDMEFFRVLLNEELPYLGVDMHRPAAALEVLASFAEHAVSEPMKEWTESLLARLRLCYPGEVDDFLDEQNASADMRVSVQTKQPVETVGMMIGVRSWFFLRDGVILGPPALRGLFGDILASMVDYSDPKRWLDYVVREVVNLVYGGTALRRSA